MNLRGEISLLDEVRVAPQAVAALRSRAGEGGRQCPEADDLVRVIDEDGEDCLYPADWFVAVEVPRVVELSLLKAS